MNAAANAPTTPSGRCRYKGREYLILWAGQTNYGYRLKLAFPDNLDETFWIDRDKADQVQLFETEPRREPVEQQPAPPENVPAFCTCCGQRLPD